MIKQQKISEINLQDAIIFDSDLVSNQIKLYSVI